MTFARFHCKKTSTLKNMRGLRTFLLLAAWTPILLMTGCHSPYVETSVVNSGTTVLHNIEVDYPSASFGLPTLDPGATFHYRFQIQDAGRMKVEFSDSAHKSHSGKGPYIAQGQQGTLTITLDGNGKNQWAAQLHPNVTVPAGE